LKIRTDAEKAAAEKKKNEEKASKFQAGMQAVVSMRSKGVRDDTVLDLTAKLLQVNPDVYTLWNYRREVLLDRKPSENEKQEDQGQGDEPQENLESVDDLKKEFDNLCQGELELVMVCLLKNPKSYPCWHHRQWVLENMFNPNLAQELALIEDALAKDARNFHSWDHRKWLANFAHIPIGNELTFTQTKITENFSNFSSWFARSCLLTEAHDTGLLDMTKQWDLEYSLVENAIFTDPTDQSAWFYHKWLSCIDLGNKLKMTKNDPPGDKMAITQVTASPELLSIRFSRPTASTPSIEVHVDDAVFDFNGNLLTDTKNPYLLSLWSFKGDFANKHVVIKFLKQKPVTINVKPNSIHVLTVKNLRHHQDLGGDRQLKPENIKNLKELLEMEPDNKYVNLTMSFFEEDRLALLDKLSELDPMRRPYFEDQKSKIVLEKRLEEDQDKGSSVSLSGLNLTRFHNPDRLIHLRRLDLSNNSFRVLGRAFNDLVNLVTLILDSNRIDSVENNVQLLSLVNLSLKNNCISSEKELFNLEKCSRLEKVFIHGNPVLNDEQMVSKLTGCPSFCLEDVFVVPEEEQVYQVCHDKLHS